MPVGNFPGLNMPRQNVHRMPVNDYDKSTIVSIVPKKIVEVKHTITPGYFTIPEPVLGGYSVLEIGSSSWFKEMEEGQPYLEIQCNSLQVAEAIVLDYMTGLLACNMGDCKPGLFYVPGSWTKETIIEYVDKKKNITFADLLHRAKEDQKRWFMTLINEADILWARTGGNPIAIPDDARLAGKILQINKPWMQDYRTMQLEPCRACGELVNPNFPVCKNCKAIINEDAAMKAGIKFAS